MSTPEETFSKTGPICPYCKHQHYPDDSHYYSEGDFTCEECGKDFVMGVYVSHSWTCEPKEDE